MKRALFLSQCLRGAAALLTAGLLAGTAHANLLLTEVQSDQATAGRNDYWELTNTGSEAVSLGNWKWDDDSRNPADAAAVTIPAGTSIAPGESIIFTALPAATFRSWWGIGGSVQVISTGAAPGLGSGDGIGLFNSSGTEVFFFSYAANGFTRSNGSASTGGHAGLSSGGTASTQALVLDPTFGTASPRYTAATVGKFKAFASAGSAADIGSPGVSGLVREVDLSMYVRVGRY
ncbi:MAG TPA: lamin tail domain-containing protein, partial [Prosthecobacter sp.]|nr:lamin tail domain-containing protein [Prosthecobacter sp.]